MNFIRSASNSRKKGLQITQYLRYWRFLGSQEEVSRDVVLAHNPARLVRSRIKPLGFVNAETLSERLAKQYIASRSLIGEYFMRRLVIMTVGKRIVERPLSLKN